MKRLLVLRHAKSSWSNRFQADHDRPLNERGKWDAPRMGRWLARQALIPDLIISSTAERALTTAEQVALHSGYAGELQVTAAFYLAAPATYIDVLAKTGGTADLVMVVGHNPGMEQLVERLGGRAAGMPTAAVACIELPINAWSELGFNSQGTLKHHWIPKGLPEDFE